MNDSTRSPGESAWSCPQTVAGFATSPPNAALVQFAAAELRRTAGGHLLDVGCGAGRNAVPLAQLGWNVLGVDLSRPMVHAAAQRARSDGVTDRCRLAIAAMDSVPVRNRSCDLIVAHGIWNLARSGDEFRAAVREAARIARPGAALFVFTFSRQTLAEGSLPIRGESFVFTEFSGEPQCFLTEAQLVTELASARFAPDAAVPLIELNRSPDRTLRVQRVPVIWQGAFRYAR